MLALLCGGRSAVILAGEDPDYFSNAAAYESFFNGMLTAADDPEDGAASEDAAAPEDVSPAEAPQAERERLMPAVTKRRQILPIRKETECFDMALLCDFCYDNINT